MGGGGNGVVARRAGGDDDRGGGNGGFEDSVDGRGRWLDGRGKGRNGD